MATFNGTIQLGDGNEANITGLQLAELALATDTKKALIGDGSGNTIHIGGFDRVAKTGAYTVVAADRSKIIDCTANTFTVSVTAAATLKSGFCFGVYNSGSGTITVDGDGSETFRDPDGAHTTLTLTQGMGVLIECDGSNFAVVASNSGGGGGISDGDYGDVTVSGTGTAFNVDSASKSFAFKGDVSDSISADQNDYSPAGMADASVLRITPTTSTRTITGLAGGADGRLIIIINPATGVALKLTHEDTASTAANRFSFAGANDITLSNRASLALWYDATSSRWRQIAPNVISQLGVNKIVGNPLGAAGAASEIGLSGLTISGGSLTIDSNGVSDAMLRDSAALSVIGRSANSTGDPADIAAGTDGHVLRRSGTTLGFGTLATAGLGDAQVTLAKIANAAANSKLLGSGASGSGSPYTEITVGTGLTMTGTTLSADAADTSGSYLLGSNTSIPAGNTVANTTSETAFSSSVTIPASTLAAGDVIPVRLSGSFGFNGSGTLTLKIKLAGTAVVTTAAVAPGLMSISNQGWTLDASILVLSTGASGTADGQATLVLNQNNTSSTNFCHDPAGTATVTIDTTADIAVTATAQWSSAAAANTITCRQFIVGRQTTASVASGASAAAQSDQETGTSTTTYVSPGRQHFHPSAAKAWIRFNGTGTIATVASYNVSSITDNGTGAYTVSVDTDFSGASVYCAVMSGGGDNAPGTNYENIHDSTNAMAAGSFQISCTKQSGGSPTATDFSRVQAVCFGDF